MKKAPLIIMLPILSFNGTSQAMQMQTRPNVPQLQVTNPNDPIVNMQGEINMVPDNPPMTQTITSDSGEGAAAITAYFLNEDTFNTTVTNNGSGANTVSKTYGDGWSGKGYNKLATGCGPNGIKCYGFTLEFTNATTGAQASGLSTAAPTWLMANLVGANMVPKGFVLSSGVRNTQYLSGTMTVKGVFYLGTCHQLSYNVPVNTTAVLTVLTAPF